MTYSPPSVTSSTSKPNYRWNDTKVCLIGSGMILFSEKLFYLSGIPTDPEVEKQYHQELASKGPKAESKEVPSSKVLSEFKERNLAAKSWFDTFIGEEK